jgi:hypothetical protein
VGCGKVCIVVLQSPFKNCDYLFLFFRCARVRTLKGVPQPSALCPVGDHGVAVLCRREMRVIDLDNGKFKVRVSSHFFNLSLSLIYQCNFYFSGHLERCNESKNAILWFTRLHPFSVSFTESNVRESHELRVW